MAYPIKPLRDAELAGEFSRKFFGKFAAVRVKPIHVRSIGQSYDVYEVGVISPQGDFMVKADSSHDFAEAFFKAGHRVDTTDDIWLRHEVRKLAKREAPEPEQVEMF